MKKIYIAAVFFLFSLVCFYACSNDDKYTPVDTFVIASDDTVSSTLVAAVEIDVLQNDTTGAIPVASTVSIVNGSDTDSNGTLDKLEVANEGIWTVNPTTGKVTFTPVSNYVGNPTQISYTVKNAQGNVSNAALVTINAQQITIVDLTQVPLPKLSDYNFFIGDIKNQIPALGVIKYEPASSLFTDYAHKKRFVWMPIGTKSTFNGDENALELPVGAALIKTFYYDDVQPAGTTRIIETRLMIRKSTGWKFYEYIWNAAQTDAFLDVSENGGFTEVNWIDENSVNRSVNYRMPSQAQCVICHKKIENVNGTEVTINIPIGIKPQNLNFEYNYTTETKNQLIKWIESGYLDNNFTLPTLDKTTVNYNDTSKPISQRARSYFDINCAHCHSDNKHCGYRPMRFAFNDTSGNGIGLTNLGVCVNTQDMQGFGTALNKIVTPGNVDRSMLFYRLNTVDETYRMPLHGRSIIHDEGIALITQWINSLQTCP